MGESKKFIFIVSTSLLVVVLFACSRELPLIPPSKHTHPREYSYMDTIKKYSHPRVDHFQIDLSTRDSLNLVQPSLVRRFLSTDQTYFDYSSELEINDYSNYYFFDYQNFKTWVSFSILADTESGFMELYQYTYLKTSGSITSCLRIAVYEADGGASRNDDLKYSRLGKQLTVRSQSFFDEDLFTEYEFNGCYSRSFDSIVSKYVLSPTETVYSIDTVFSSMDTICN